MKAEQIVILTIEEEEYLVRHFQSNGVDNPCVDWDYLEQTFFSMSFFFMSCKYFPIILNIHLFDLVGVVY